MLEARSLEKRVGSQRLLADVSISIGAGEAVAVLGPSGAGKTLLLRSLGFIDTPDSGFIRFKEKEWNFGSQGSRIGPPWPDVVVMFQSGGTAGHISLLENVVFPYRRKESERGKIASAKTFAERLSLSSVLNQNAAVCSVGQRQRAAFIRTIVSDANLILLDEPTASLDPTQTANVGDIILEEKARGRAFVISTHMLGLARKVCNRFIYIQQGSVLACGDINLLDDPTAHEDLRQFVRLTSVR